MSSLRIAAISLGVAAGLAAPVSVRPARRPEYGGTLRMEIAARISSLDPGVASANSQEDAAKSAIEPLLYDHRNADGTFAGTTGSGPFRVAAFDPGSRILLAENDRFSGGRPFVDAIEIQMGKNGHDRMLDLDLGKADFTEIPAEEARRMAGQGVRVSMSQPDELLALVFIAGQHSTEDAQAREAVAHSIDRAAIVNFILQKGGELAGGLLPQWSNGTAFLFSTEADIAHAKTLWAQIGGSPKITLGYDADDSLEQAIAERIVVNARDAGIPMEAKATAGGTAEMAGTGYDARLMRLRMPSLDPREALSYFSRVLGPVTGIDAPSLPEDALSEAVYEQERAIVSTYRVVPLVRLPEVYGLSARVKDWIAPAAGEGWPLADVWLEGNPQ